MKKLFFLIVALMAFSTNGFSDLRVWVGVSKKSYCNGDCSLSKGKNDTMFCYFVLVGYHSNVKTKGSLSISLGGKDKAIALLDNLMSRCDTMQMGKLFNLEIPGNGYDGRCVLQEGSKLLRISPFYDTTCYGDIPINVLDKMLTDIKSDLL